MAVMVMVTVNYQGVYNSKDEEFYKSDNYTVTALQAELSVSEFKIGSCTYTAKITEGVSQKNITRSGRSEDVGWAYLEVENKKAGVIIFFNGSHKARLYLGMDNTRLAELTLTSFDFTAQLPDDTEIVWNDWHGCGEKDMCMPDGVMDNGK
jgi:hypothetical protein